MALAQLLEHSVLFLEYSTLPLTCPNVEAKISQQLDCSFYTDCLEAKYHCGPDGYPVGYGNKYCEKFLEHRDEFSDAGQQWIDGTLTCLKKALEPDMITSETETCDKVNDDAFASHVQCYVDNGFCDLAFDGLHPFKTSHFYYDLLQVYEVKDFASLMAIKAVFETVQKCSGLGTPE